MSRLSPSKSIDIGFGRLRYNDDGITRRVIREEKLSVSTPRGHVLSRRKGPLKLKHTAGLLPKRAASKLLALVPSSIRRLGRDDVEYIILDEPEISSPIIMSCRTNDRSPLLAHFLKLLDEFDEWTETKVREFS